MAASTLPADFDPERLLCELRRASRTTILQSKLETLSAGLHENHSDLFVIATVGNGIRASEAVAAALWAFLRYSKDPQECIIRAVGFGGDTDTIGAMAGALHGSSWIPARWYDNIENGPRGRDEIVTLARQLAAVALA